MEHSTNSKVLFRSLVNSITLDESKGEKESIVFTLLRRLKGVTREDVLAGKEIPWTVADFSEEIARLNANEPVQYILGAADFFGREFYVNSSVLIPRPETELLVVESLAYLNGIRRDTDILDIGTGSGCIAITLFLEATGCRVTAIDVSEAALAVARGNAERLGAKVHFEHHDIIKKASFDGKWDLIVSNPPYVLMKESSLMKKNVVEFEPHLALFVPDNDPLVFYNAIAGFGMDQLKDDGLVLVEINEAMGDETVTLFSDFGYEARIIRDLDGKDRIVAARKRGGNPAP